MGIIRVKDATDFVGSGDYKVRREAYNWVRLQRVLHWGSVHYVLDNDQDLSLGTRRVLRTEEAEELIVWPPGSGRTLAKIVHQEEWNWSQDMCCEVVWTLSHVPYVAFQYGQQYVVAALHDVCVSEEWAKTHGAA